MQVFELVRGQHSLGGVTASGVVPTFDPFEDLAGQFDSGAPVLPVEEFALHRGPERFDAGVDDQLGALHGVEGPADDPSAAGVHHGAAVDLEFTRGVFGDAADAQFVQAGAGEPELDEIITGGDPPGRARLRRSRKAMETTVVHQQPDQSFTDGDAAALE